MSIKINIEHQEFLFKSYIEKINNAQYIYNKFQ